MIIGVVKEIKDKESRVALTPASVECLIQQGHRVLVEKGAGLEAGFADQEYRSTGAEIVSMERAWDTDMVVKVKEPLQPEYPYLKGQILFTYLHLAGVNRALTDTLLRMKTTAVAYETVEDANGTLPLLAPMSAVAGNMSTLMGSYYLADFNRGKGVQLGSVLGRKHGKVVVVGDGVVGRHAAKVAVAMGTNVTLLGLRTERFSELREELGGSLEVYVSEPGLIARLVEESDLVVGAVLRHGARAAHVITEAMVKRMQPGSVIVDVSIDQGGCVETSRPTTHSDPVFMKHGVIHYCVTNMPGAFPRTATIAFNEAILPYSLRLAKDGIAALRSDRGFAKGLNTYKGFITCRPVAEGLDMMASFREFEDIG